MRFWLITALILAVSLLAGCEPYPGPTATCFSLVEGDCEFQVLPGREG